MVGVHFSAEHAGDAERNPPTRNLTPALGPHDAAPNAERRTPNAERRTPNAERRTRHPSLAWRIGRCYSEVPSTSLYPPSTMPLRILTVCLFIFVSDPCRLHATGPEPESAPTTQPTIPLRYLIHLEPNLEAERFEGAEDIQLQVRSPIRDVTLDLYNIFFKNFKKL